jgi:hypothetical protein
VKETNDVVFDESSKGYSKELIDDIEDSFEMVASVSIKDFTRLVGTPELVRELSADDGPVGASELVRESSTGDGPMEAPTLVRASSAGDGPMGVGASKLVRDSSGDNVQAQEHFELNQFDSTEHEDSTEVRSYE